MKKVSRFVPVWRMGERELSRKSGKLSEKWLKKYDKYIAKGDYEGAERFINKCQKDYEYKVAASEKKGYKYNIDWDYISIREDRFFMEPFTRRDKSSQFWEDIFIGKIVTGVGAAVGGVVGFVAKGHSADDINNKLLKESAEYKGQLDDFYADKAQMLNDKNYIADHTFTKDGLYDQAKDWFDKSHQDIWSGMSGHEHHEVVVDPRYSDYYFDYINSDGFGIKEGARQIKDEFLQQNGCYPSLGDYFGSIALGALAVAAIASLPLIKAAYDAHKLQKALIDMDAQDYFNNTMSCRYANKADRGEAICVAGEYQVKE